MMMNQPPAPSSIPPRQNITKNACSCCHNSKRKCLWTKETGEKCDRCAKFGLDCVAHKPLRRGRATLKRPPGEQEDPAVRLNNAQERRAKMTLLDVGRWGKEDTLKVTYHNPIKKAKMAAAEKAIKAAIQQSAALGASQAERKAIVEFAVWSAAVAAAKAAQAETKNAHALLFGAESAPPVVHDDWEQEAAADCNAVEADRLSQGLEDLIVACSTSSGND
jgi:hypothetical protein